MALTLGICIRPLFANWKTRKMDWSKITNDCQTWKKAGRIWLHGNGWLTSTKTQVWTKEKTLWGRVLVVTAVTTNCDILPSTTEIPLTALTLAMHGWWWWRWWRGLKKENEKRILLDGKKIQTFPCLIPSLTCVSEVIQHWYKIRPRAILLLALNRRKRNRD